jgi:hypothetical protein
VFWKRKEGKICRDNWVPRGDMKITSNLMNSRIIRAAYLINQEDHSWKEDLVRIFLMAHDADEILKIHLPNCEQEDFITWTYEKHGMFTVQSAYNFSLDLCNNTPPNASSNPNGDRRLWKTIWNSRVLPEVKIFT